MSELKVYKIGDLCFDFKIGKDVGIDFYLKSEADDVIAKLKTQIEEQKRLRDMALASIPNVLKIMKIIQHQKYKRCINMAKWCFTKSNYHYIVGRNEGGKFAKENFLKSRLYSKWCERWKKLAEQFKEDK